MTACLLAQHKRNKKRGHHVKFNNLFCAVMEGRTFLEKFTDFVRSNPVFCSLLALGLCLLVGGFFVSKKAVPKKEEGLEFVENKEAPAQKENVTRVLIDVSGGVKKPGVYEAPFGSRVGELIEKAGGFSESADLAWIEKNLNQAAKVTDGMKIFIPREGEKAPAVAGVNTGILSTVGGSQQPGLISINTASASELDSLPEIGGTRAGAIINGRPYTSIDELLTRKIIPKNAFEAIKEKIGI